MTVGSLEVLQVSIVSTSIASLLLQLSIILFCSSHILLTRNNGYKKPNYAWVTQLFVSCVYFWPERSFFLMHRTLLYYKGREHSLLMGKNCCLSVCVREGERVSSAQCVSSCKPVIARHCNSSCPLKRNEQQSSLNVSPHNGRRCHRVNNCVLRKNNTNTLRDAGCLFNRVHITMRCTFSQN